MNTFASGKKDVVTGNVAYLVAKADQVHLNTALFGVVERVMLELTCVDIAAEFFVDSRQQIEIESRGDPVAVVVSSVQNVDRFFGVDADQQFTVWTESFARIL